MWLQQTDYHLPGIGEAIDLTRTYNSMRQASGIFGFGWASKYDQYIFAVDDRLVKVYLEDGRAVYFGRTDTTSIFTPIGGIDMHASMTKNTDNTYTLTFKDSRVHKFSADGRLLWQKDRNGNQTTLTYDVSGYLSSVTDAFGRTLTFTWNATNSAVYQISDSIGTVATYEYFSGTTLLKKVTYNDGSKYKFEYTTPINGKTYLTTVKDALDNILETHLYDSQGRATTSEKHGGAEKYTFDYSNPAYTTVTDALTRTTKYWFNKSKGRNVITKTEDSCHCGGSGSEETNYEYDAAGNRRKRTDYAGRITNYTHDNLNRLQKIEYDGDQRSRNGFVQLRQPQSHRKDDGRVRSRHQLRIRIDADGQSEAVEVRRRDVCQI